MAEAYLDIPRKGYQWIGFRPKGGPMSEEITINDFVLDKLYFQLIDQTSLIQPNKSLEGRFFPH